MNANVCAEEYVQNSLFDVVEWVGFPYLLYHKASPVLEKMPDLVFGSTFWHVAYI